MLRGDEGGEGDEGRGRANRMRRRECGGGNRMVRGDEVEGMRGEEEG